MREFVLCSASPRRRELFQMIVEHFQVKVPSIEEVPDEKATSPHEMVISLARQKAQSVLHQFHGEVLVCADTMVFLEGIAMGKPKDVDEAVKMLKQLEGKPHIVCTGLAVADSQRGNIQLGYETTKVIFDHMSDEEIQNYVATGEPMDKAGAYGIQGMASKFVVGIEGCYFNVVGLPIHRLYMMLKNYL